MKKPNLFILFLLMLMLGICLVACGDDEQPSDPITFTVTFDTQGGNEIAPITFTEGVTIILPENPTKDGYIFDGWYIDKDLSNKLIEPQTISDNITLYAKWNCNHTPVADIAVGADCTHTGLTEGSHCSKCGDVLVAQQIVPIAHKLGEWIDEIPANCTNEGAKGHYECLACHKCFDIEHNEIDDLAIECHHFNENGVCAVCGYFETGLEFALNDDGESWAVVGIGTFNGTDLKIPSVNYDTKPLTAIKEYAFYKCSITNVIIPGSVKNIGDYAFCDCGEIESITLSNGVVNIGNFAFDNCSGITDIIIPDSVKSIGALAFSGCTGLTSIIIPDNAISIGESVFQDCSSLKSVTVPFLGRTEDDVEHWLLTGLFHNVPSSLKSIVVTKGTFIGHYAFGACKGLTSVTISNSVKRIEQGAFLDCTGLTTITIPDSVISIGDIVFYGCSSLTDITIGSGVTNIGKFFIQNCSALNRIDYRGTVAQWNAITFEDDWDTLSSEYTIYCTDGTIAKDGTITYYTEE